jgi:ABC-type oligopeptide transport system substrate-binding subunit
MKKILYIAMALVIAISLAACGTQNSKKANTTNNIKITYTKEFTYLPSYNGVKATSFTPATKKAPLGIAKYTIKNTTDTKLYEDYESILKNDGWTITKDQKYYSIVAKKDKHIADILIQKTGKDIILMVISK